MARPVAKNSLFGSIAPTALPEMRIETALAAQTAQSSVGNGIRRISLTEIARNPFQPRKVFNQIALEEMAANMRQREEREPGSGVIEPVTLTLRDGQYFLIDGERRWLSAGIAGLTTIPAVVRENVSDDELREVALLTFEHREDLSVPERADAYRELETIYQTKWGDKYTRKRLAEEVLSKKPDYVTKILWVFDFTPAVVAALRDGRVSHKDLVRLHPLLDDKSAKGQRALEKALSAALGGATAEDARKAATGSKVAAKEDPIKGFGAWLKTCQKANYVSLVEQKCGAELAAKFVGIMGEIAHGMAQK